MAKAKEAKAMPRPRNDRVLVKRVEGETFRSEAGLVMPDAYKERGQEGIVVEIGPGRLLDNGTRGKIEGLEVGNRVLFGKYSGSEIQYDGELYIVMREDDIMLVLEAE